jgi:hypothetical protein
MAGIIDKARQGRAFKRPDIASFVPPELQDTVGRLSAAGQKIMYSPQMREELIAAVQDEAPVPQKLAENVAGLLLTLDGQSKGGIPEGAIFPAGLDLLAEAAEVLTQSGTQVTREEYNEAARMLFVILGRKLGIQDDQMMGAAEQAAGVAAPAAQGSEGGEDVAVG